MACDLDLLVCVEGVERPETMAALEGMGFPLAQGFLFGRPQPFADFHAKLAAQSAPARTRPG